MARSYDGANNSSAREQVEQSRQLEKARNQKIELGVIIAAIVIAVLSIIINVVKCVGAVSATKNYNIQRVEAESTLEQLNMKLQDPTAQNYVYEDPIVGNMTEMGQKIALMQNQLIAASQEFTHLSYDNGGLHNQTTTQTSGGAASLSPNDAAPSVSELPDQNEVEENEISLMQDDLNSSSETNESALGSDSISETQTDTEISETDIQTDTQVTPEPQTQTNTQTDAEIDISSSTDPETGMNTEANTDAEMNILNESNTAQDVPDNDGQYLAQLIIDFQNNCFAQKVNNVDNVPKTELTAWSWYGVWEFSGTYDYSVSEVPQMSAIWSCYEPSDVGHLRPLAFVTAIYTESTKKFTNPTAYYTQYYVTAAEGQSLAFNNPQSGNIGGMESAEGSVGNESLNGEGSENEYVPDIKDDTIPSPSGTSQDNPNDGTPAEGEEVPSVTPNLMDGSIKPANPDGAILWTPGTGASSGSGSSTGGTGAWNPGSGAGTSTNVSSGTGAWNPNGTSTNTGTNAGTGSWNPNGSASQSTSNSTGSWSPAN